VFRATGESKAAARFNVAQTAMNVLGPTIEAVLERRKVEKQQRNEAKKAEHLEYLQEQAKMLEGGDEMDNCSNENKEKKESSEIPNDTNTCGDTEQKDTEQKDTEQKPQAVHSDVGAGDDQETKPRIKGRNALRVLKDIRPGTSCVEKVSLNAATGHHVAQVVVDGRPFEGDGGTLALAKAHAAASALSTLFSLSLEYSPRKNFSVMIELCRTIYMR